MLARTAVVNFELISWPSIRDIEVAPYAIRGVISDAAVRLRGFFNRRVVQATEVHGTRFGFIRGLAMRVRVVIFPLIRV